MLDLTKTDNAERNQTVPIKAAVPAGVLVMINSGRMGKKMFGLP